MTRDARTDMSATGASGDWQARALAHWRTRGAWVLDRQIAIAETPAPTGRERERAALLRRELDAPGTSLRIDAVGNVIARISAPHLAPDAAPIVCLAHLDTVFAHDAPLQAVRHGTQVHCPGIGDNSRGLAAMLALSHTLRMPGVNANLRHPVEIVATVGEEGEGNLRGARAYFDDAAAANRRTIAAIAIDGPGDSTIVHHAVGSHRQRVRLLGHGGHSWANAGTPNPINAAGALIASLARLGERERPYAVVTVSRMGGGEALTSIPREAWIDVDIRAIEGARVVRLREAIRQLAERHAADESRHRPELALVARCDTLGERPAGHLDTTHPLVALAMHATERAGRRPRSGSASTDANVPLSRGIPAIAIGAGGTGGDAHTLGEWFDDDESEVGLTRVLDIVTTLACAQ